VQTQPDGLFIVTFRRVESKIPTPISSAKENNDGSHSKHHIE